MLKLLIKKQLSEIFKMYLYNTKKNKKRSKTGVIVWFVFFFLIMVGVLGGMFTALSIALCPPLAKVGMAWLFFIIMSVIAIVLGAFGSIFNTYSGLYLAKDNDLLLSMPIPLKYVIASRLIGVYLMGTMYSSIVIIPAIIVYFVSTSFTVSTVICALLLVLIISLLVLVLSCLLGWCVAKISLKIKNKSFAVVIASVLFIGLYYFIYFKAAEVMQDLIYNAAVYGEKIRGAANILYMFGRIGEGDVKSALIFTAVIVLITILTWVLLRRTFLGIATSSGKQKRNIYKERRYSQRSVFSAVLSKEFSRFKSSPSYILNCGIGILMIPLCSVILLVKAKDFLPMLESIMQGRQGGIVILFAAALLALASMNDMAAPSISLEGKSIWIPQSLPVDAKTVIRAKTMVQLILSCIPMAFALVIFMIILPSGVEVKILLCVFGLVYTAFFSVVCTFLGLRFANTNWTSEIVPIKQSASVVLAMFGGFAVAAVFAGLYFLTAYKIGVVMYLLAFTALTAVLSALIQHYNDTKGADIFSEL